MPFLSMTNDSSIITECVSLANEVATVSNRITAWITLCRLP